MKSMIVATFGLAVAAGALVLAQAPAPANLQASQDPRYADVIAKCKVPPDGAQQRGGGAAHGWSPGAGSSPAGEATGE